MNLNAFKIIFNIKYLKVKIEKEKELQEKLYFEEMDEETYMQLPEEKRKEIDEALLETKKQRLKR